MTEAYTAPPDPLQDFDYLAAVAKHNLTGRTTWFTPNTPGQTSFTIWEYSHQEAPSGTIQDYRYDHHYIQWNTADLEAQPVVRASNAKDPSPEFSARFLTIPLLCATFLRSNRSSTDIAHIMDTYTKWGAENSDPVEGHTSRAIAYLLQASLLAETNPLLDATGPLWSSLHNMQPGHGSYDSYLTAINTHLRRFLLEPLPKDIQTAISQGLRTEQEVRSTVLHMAQVFEDHGLLDPLFWLSAGVQRGGIFTIPGMLDVTIERLGAGRNIKIEPTSLQGTIRDFITLLFTTYARDPQRNGKTLSELKTQISNGYGTTGLSMLIAVGQGVTKGINEQLTKSGAPPRELLPDLDRHNVGHLSLALTRVLHVLRRPNLSPEELDAQLEAETAHAALIDVLTGILTVAASASKADLQLRYPDATEEDIQTIMRARLLGVPPSKVYAWNRARRRQTGGFKAQNSKRPGYGALS